MEEVTWTFFCLLCAVTSQISHRSVALLSCSRQKAHLDVASLLDTRLKAVPWGF